MRILIIEDETKIAKALKRGLEQEAYAVDTIEDGKQGLMFALTEEYDLLILDRMLPRMDGMQICGELREKGKSLPILMLTAKDKVRDRVEGLNAGADDYLIKPFAFEELLARVRALTRRPAETLGSVLKMADLSVDTVTYEVNRDSTSIPLSATEFSLLVYLMRHPNHVLTKDQIINHVWDYDADILPNTVEVYIGYLRNKIDKPFGISPLIHTVRGFGYKMSEKA